MNERPLKNEDILILPADKGRSTVVLDKDDYENKVKQMLSDEKTYEVLNKDPTSRYKRKLGNILKRLKEEEKITTAQYKELNP